MEQNKKLSLKEEMEKEAQKIEQDVVDNPTLEDVKVSDEMEAALLAEIQSYEKKRAMEYSKENDMGENTTEEFAAELVPDMPNFSDRTNDGDVAHLSEEDMEALRRGRELIKKEKEDGRFKVNTDYHKHLNGDKNEKTGRKSTGEKAKIFRMPRKKRVIVALVAVCVLVVGTGVTSVGSKSYLKVLWEKIHGEEPMKVINVDDMDTQESEDGEEVTAYREIRDQLGVLSVRIGAKPKGMHLVSYKIDGQQSMAQLFFEYKKEVIRYTIYQNDKDSSLSQKEDDILIDEFEVSTEKQKIEVKEYEVKEDNNTRYIANFTYQGINYQLKGIMKREEIKGILENLTYF